MTQFLTLALAIAAAPAFAGPNSLTLTYDTFEVAVPHVDLETCPAALADDGVFCRATLAHDQIHVFAFSEAGETPLVGFASFEADGLSGIMN